MKTTNINIDFFFHSKYSLVTILTPTTSSATSLLYHIFLVCPKIFQGDVIVI
ncbi:hypothetical protein 7t3_0292 [Salmonella phage 7t3]|nr:hypothetical protein 7t3_0292 [Salmonella phage 7t3]